MWLGCALSSIDLMACGNYGTFLIEWWIPMYSKKKSKTLVPKECWTKQWASEVTHPKRISITTILYSHKMPSHKDKGPIKTHLIPKPSKIKALANLAA